MFLEKEIRMRVYAAIALLLAIRRAFVPASILRRTLRPEERANTHIHNLVQIGSYIDNAFFILLMVGTSVYLFKRFLSPVETLSPPPRIPHIKRGLRFLGARQQEADA